MYFGDTELVGVVGKRGEVIHGVGAVRIPQRLGDAPRPAQVELLGATLPAPKLSPPSFKGTHVGQIALPQDKKQPGWKWNGRVWVVMPRADAAREIREKKLATGTATSKPAATPAKKPGRKPTVKGTVFGQVALPNDVTQHAWLWNGTAWIGISREDAKDKWATIARLGLKDPNAPKAPSDGKARPAQPPGRPGQFEGEIFLPANKAEHAWRWNAALSQWQGISRSDAVKTTSVATNRAAAESQKGPIDKFTDALATAARAVGLSKPTLRKPAPLPDASVATVTDGDAPAGYVPTTAGDMRLPTARDPDADGQTRPGRAAPPPTVGVAGTYPSTARDANGDGLDDRSGAPVPRPTVGVAGTFPSTPLDADGDGRIDSTGAPAPAPILGQRGSFPATPDDLDGDGLNDTTGKPVDANALHEAGLGKVLLPAIGVVGVMLLTSRSRGRGGMTRQLR